MREFIVKVNERSLDLRQALQAMLQTLPDIVSFPQRHVPGQHDVHLHQEVAAEMKRSDRVDVPDLGVVVHTHPGQLAEEVWPSRVTRKSLNLLTSGLPPVVDDVHTDGQGATWIDVSEAVVARRHVVEVG